MKKAAAEPIPLATNRIDEPSILLLQQRTLRGLGRSRERPERPAERGSLLLAMARAFQFQFTCFVSLHGIVAHQWNWYPKHVCNPNPKGLSDKNSEHMDSRPMNYRVVGSN